VLKKIAPCSIFNATLVEKTAFITIIYHFKTIVRAVFYRTQVAGNRAWKRTRLHWSMPCNPKNSAWFCFCPKRNKQR